METAEILKGENHPMRDFVITLGLSDNSKGVMFVLYSVLKPENIKSRYINPYSYLGQLSSDFKQACITARKRIRKYEIKVWNKEAFERAKPSLIPFGKYKGKTIEEVFDIDHKYIFWMANNAKVKSKKLSDKLSDYASLSKDLIVEENKQASNPHLPVEKDKIIRKLYIYTVYTTSDDIYGFESTVTRLKDDEGNRYQYKGKSIGSKGDTIELKCKVKKHFTSMGMNYNVLNLR